MAITLSGWECLSLDVRDRYQAELNKSDPAVDLAQDEVIEDDVELPLADPGKGDILVLGGGLAGKYESAKTGTVDFFDVKSEKFAKSGKLGTNRVGASAVVLTKGSTADDVLVVGGGSGEIVIKRDKATLKGKPLATGETYDPDKENSKPTAGKLATARLLATQTALPNGKVLIAGGYAADSAAIRTIETFDPVAKKYSVAGNLLQPRAGHTATLLPDGRVLFTGGVSTDYGVPTPTAELFNPATGSSSPASNNMQIALGGHSAVLIEGCDCARDGKVLIAGGFNGFGFGGERTLESASSVVMLFDPATAMFTSSGVPQLNEERMLQTATSLGDGRILFAGGVWGQGFYGEKKFQGVYGGILNSAEIYDAATNKLDCVGGKAKNDKCPQTMANARVVHGAIRVGKNVLLVGGIGAKSRTSGGGGAPLKTAEMFNADKETFKSVGAMSAARIFPALAVVP